MKPMDLDPRLNAFRPDLADVRLRGVIEAARFTEGQPARIRVGRARGRSEPNSGAPTGTHFHYGESIVVFDAAAGFYWCQSLRDGYVAYVDEREVSFGPGTITTETVQGTGCYSYSEPDLRSEAMDFFPRGSRVESGGTRYEQRGAWYRETPERTFILERCLSGTPFANPDIVENACRYLGVPYLWGGRSFLGLDCSALVQNAFEDAGIFVPRDSDLQQEAIGERVFVSCWDDLVPGDLVFFPGHVVLYRGDQTVIHADGGSMMVRCERLSEVLQRSGIGHGDVTVKRP